MKVAIFTDGSCEPNPGIGGWAFILIREDKSEFSEYGGESQSTNNRMELTAVIKALEYLKPKDSEIHIFSDSQYVVSGINLWLEGWIKKGLQKPNMDLWNKIYLYMFSNKLICHWVKGHSGIDYNEKVDRLSELGRKSIESIGNVPSEFHYLLKKS